MKWQLAALAASCLVPTFAHAQAGPNPPPMREAVAVCDPAFPSGSSARCLKPSATGSMSTSGFDSGPVQATSTPANSSHAAGTSIGGLFTLAMARIAGGSGEVTQVSWKSSGASTGSLVIRIWAKSPANTTCTDNSAFAGSATDDAFLVTPPFTITPAAPGSTTGDANTYAALTSTNYGFVNADTTLSKNLYACAVTVATDTADENKAVYIAMDALQN